MHLQMCAMLSQINQHNQALQNAKSAINFAHSI